VAHPLLATACSPGVGQVEERLVLGLLLAPPMPLHVEEDAAGAESLDDPREPVGVEVLPPGAESVSTPAGRRAPRRALSIPKCSRPAPFGTPAFMRVISRQRFL